MINQAHVRVPLVVRSVFYFGTNYKDCVCLSSQSHQLSCKDDWVLLLEYNGNTSTVPRNRYLVRFPDGTIVYMSKALYWRLFEEEVSLKVDNTWRMMPDGNNL